MVGYHAVHELDVRGGIRVLGIYRSVGHGRGRRGDDCKKDCSNCHNGLLLTEENKRFLQSLGYPFVVGQFRPRCFLPTGEPLYKAAGTICETGKTGENAVGDALF
jgi:hypothetical protein